MMRAPSASIPWTEDRSRTAAPPAEDVVILGIRIRNVTRHDAAQMFATWTRGGAQPTRAVYIVNAHTLTLAAKDPDYHEVLNDADAVFGDGTGVRWAARMRGVRMKDNLVGTDLLPHLFASPEGSTLRYFLLGGEPGTAAQATLRLHSHYPHLSVVGYHHGYFAPGETAYVVDYINESTPDVLLVAMGNPLQEKWIHDHRRELRVPICIGVGGLFDHWSGRLHRAPLWMRKLGIEWMQILFQQPHKWQRYVVGNFVFLSRVWRTAAREREVMATA